MRKQIIISVLIIFFACGLAELLARVHWLEPLENTYYDLWHRLAGVRAQSHRVTIVAIDDASLLKYQDEPLAFWSPHFAAAIEVLRQVGVAVIGLDMVLQVSAEAWLKKFQLPQNTFSRTYDIPLRAQLVSGQVVLAGLLAYNSHNQLEYLLPLKEYWMLLPGQLASVGLTNMYNDADGVVRHFVPAFSSEKIPGLGFATLLAMKATAQQITGSTVEPDIATSLQPRLIGFIGPPQTVPRLSFSRLLAPDADSDPDVLRLKNHVVIIALEHTGNQDVHLTPYVRSFFGVGGQMMSGPELHANIIESLLTTVYPGPISPWIYLIALISTVVYATIIFFRIAFWKSVLVGVGIAAVWSGAAYIAFLSHKILPVTPTQIALFLSYLATLGVRLTGEERERMRLRHMFGRFVSDDVVEHLLAAGHHPDLGGEAYQVTVLFSDIRDFTTISEQLTPSEAVEMLNAYFSLISDAILEEGGSIDKFIGDAVMAVFGAPALFPDHALRALRVALRLKQASQEFRTWMQTRFPGKQLPLFRVGVGLHTGEAVIGNIGSMKRMDYTAVGDTVNTASRLESASKELGWTIVASGETIRAAGKSVLTGRHEYIQVKGRHELIEVFEVTGL